MFVGNKWVLVPADACVDFYPSTIGSGTDIRVGFRVNITHDGNYANFSSTESLNEYKQNRNLLNGQQLVIEEQGSTYISKQEFDWLCLAGQAYQYGKGTQTPLPMLPKSIIIRPRNLKERMLTKFQKHPKN